ncbi:MAG: ergothioneine biosynthesis protein EgtB [Chitinophagales bacterium]
MLDLENYYQKTRQRSVLLCKPLKVEDYLPQPETFVSPAKWNLAHTTWFFEEMVLKHFKKTHKVFHPDFSYLFNSYYNNIGDKNPRDNRGFITRPGLDEIYQYRKFVDEKMLELIQSRPSEKCRELIVLGLNHEEQHQELLLTDLKYTFFQNPVYPAYDLKNDFLSDKNKESGWLKMQEGLYEIGFDGDGFSYDNEHKSHKVYLQDFQIARQLVTNGEYLDFIEAGGYEDFNLWLDDGWAWKIEKDISQPLYWKKIEDEWFQFTLSGLRKIQGEQILAHISFYEADAFARWKGMRLPTEFEWEAAADQLSWGKRWEWCNSAYLPYPGFKIAEGAVGEYNGKFMINQMVLRGASVATTPGHSRKTYRNFFHPHLQWQYSGIRLAR